MPLPLPRSYIVSSGLVSTDEFGFMHTVEPKDHDAAQSAARVLPAAIREVYRGNSFFSPSVLRRRDHHKQKAHDSGEAGTVTAAPKLSSREMEVLQLITEGKANKETADVLHISIKTVEKHRQKVMEKLNIHDTASLTRYAISAGIIESSVQPTTL